MANVQRRQKTDPNKYEGKAYLTYEEAAEYLGIRRSSLYSMITTLGIKPHKFKLDKKRYLAMEDVKRIKEIREKPWLAGEDEEGNKSADKPAA